MGKTRVNQRKNRSIKIGILIAVLVFVLLLSLSSHIPYSGSNTIYQETNSSRALTFDLKSGQTVNGHIAFWFNRVKYSVYNEHLGEIISTETSTRNGYFTFTATVDGQYYLNIHTSTVFGYSYTVSPAFLGLNAIVWIGFVITIGILSELLVALRSKHQKMGTKM